MWDLGKPIKRHAVHLFPETKVDTARGEFGLYTYNTGEGSREEQIGLFGCIFALRL